MNYIDRYEKLLIKSNTRYVRIDNLLLREYNQIIIPLGPVIQKKPEKPILYNDIFKKLNGKLIWWSWYDQNIANSEWYAVVKKKYIEIDDYSTSNIRNQVRKGLKNNIIKRIPVDLVINEGFPIFKKATEEHSKVTLSENIFKKQISTTIEFQDIINYWGVFNNDKLIGYAVVYCYGKYEANISEIRLDRTYNKQYPSYALFHTLSEEYLKTQGFEYISDGYKNLLHTTQIQSMLINKFGFEKVSLHLEMAIRFPYNLFIFVLFPFRTIIKIKALEAVFKLKSICRKQTKAIKMIALLY